MTAQTHQSTAQSGRRIAFIDGLRGLAITMVVLYHSYARWPDLVPYGDRYSHNIIFNTRIAGVQLFFIISGFVILMTLERCRSFWEFIGKRWLRLFPAMLIASLFILMTAVWFSERPRGAIGIVDLLPGILLINDQMVNSITGFFGLHPASIEGAFWSLYVEVKFYFLFGALYFIAGRRVAMGTILALYTLVLLLPPIRTYMIVNHDILPKEWLHAFNYTIAILKDLGAKNYIWFFSGSLYYLYWKDSNTRYLWLAFAFSIIGSFTSHSSLVGDVFISVIFFATFRNPAVREAFSSRVPLFIGFISYPLYLLHENMIVAMIIKIGALAPFIPYILMPVLPIAAVTLLAFIFAQYLEPLIRRIIKGIIERIRWHILSSRPPATEAVASNQ